MKTQYTLNRFIRTHLIHRNDGGYFICIGTVKLDNGIELRTIEFKIDTGAEKTVIPLAKYNSLKEKCLDLKARDLNNNVPKSIAYGVESAGMALKKPRSFDEYLSFKHVVFGHKAIKFEIGGLTMSNRTIDISYDRAGNALLGMDVLKDWDIHIGKSVISDRVVFLGCPRDRINPQYLEALEKEFKIGTTINSNRIYRGLNVSS